MDLMIAQPGGTPPFLPPPPAPVAAVCVTIDLAAWHHRDRIARIGALGPEDTAAGLIWLALHHPAACDAMLDKIEWDGIDDEDPAREPEPYCAICGADTGIFLRLGLDWRHFRGDGTTAGQIELFDAGRAPVIAWRPARILAAAR